MIVSKKNVLCGDKYYAAHGYEILETMVATLSSFSVTA